MVRCNGCGQMVPDTAMFCKYCGTQIVKDEMTSMQPSQQPQSPPPYHAPVHSRSHSHNSILSYFLMAAIVMIGVAGGFVLYKVLFNPTKDSQPIQQETNQPESKVDVTPSIHESLRDENAEQDDERVSTIGKESLNSSYLMTGQVANLPVEMRLRVNGGAVEGSYIYTGKSQTDIRLYGTLDGKNMELHEINENGEMSGIFSGSFVSGTYSGTFYRYRNGVNDKNFSFSLKCE